MTRFFSLINGLIGSLLLLYVFAGCMNSGSNPDDEHLIRVSDRVLTVLEFNQAFEISKTAYPHNLRNEPDNFKNAQLRLLNQLMVEMIILERAAELGLNVSDEELEKAVGDIKSDYPEDTFEKTLIEFAVSYESWEARLRNRLLMGKVIDSELKNQIAITSEDIAKYYEKNVKPQKPDMDSATKMEDINEMMIKHLRQEKTEEAYKKWIKVLKQRYTVEINSIQWERISGSDYSEDQNLDALNSTNK
ncbi:MAG: SurA N-terminal domain-containing protein [Desulfobacterales bacterium]|nr:SurA N-terminal domain-containing protein [Desulfobacterales bacterium]